MEAEAFEAWQRAYKDGHAEMRLVRGRDVVVSAIPVTDIEGKFQLFSGVVVHSNSPTEPVGYFSNGWAPAWFEFDTGELTYTYRGADSNPDELKRLAEEVRKLRQDVSEIDWRTMTLFMLIVVIVIALFMTG